MKSQIAKIRENGYENYSKDAFTIANIFRGKIALTSEGLVCAAYLAYIAKREGITNQESLKKYVGTLSDERRMFINEMLQEEYAAVIESSNSIDEEGLIALVLTDSSQGRMFDGEFFTPVCISKLVGKLLNISAKDSVADFCSGTGSFLREMTINNPKASYYGIEINAYRKEISAIRMELVGSNCSIKQGSAFEIEADQMFSKIFSEFPWRMNKRGAWNHLECVEQMEDDITSLKKETTTDWYFILNAIRHLKKNGKAVVIVPGGLLWNGGNNRRVIKEMVERGYIEAVISLSENMLQYTRVALSILVLSSGNKKIRLIDASNLVTLGRRQNELSDESIDQILKLMDEDSDKSRLVSIEEIEELEFSINPVRFLGEEVAVENGVRLNEVILKITRGAQINASELDSLTTSEETDYRYLMLANIKDGIISDDLPYLKEMDEKNEKYCVKNHSLLISKNGLPFKIAVAEVEEGKKLLANGNLYIIELDETKVNPYFLKAYLETENGNISLSRLAVGAVLLNIPVEALKKLMIPLPDIETQDRIARRYLEKQDELKLLKYRLSKVTDELKRIYEEG